MRERDLRRTIRDLVVSLWQPFDKLDLAAVRGDAKNARAEIQAEMADGIGSGNQNDNANENEKRYGSAHHVGFDMRPGRAMR